MYIKNKSSLGGNNVSDSFDKYRKRMSAMRPAIEKMVDEDISKCESYLSGERNETEGMELHFELITKYPPIIARFGDSLYNFSTEYGFVSQDYFGFDSMINNVNAIKYKLISFKSAGYKNISNYNNESNINIENILTATQSQIVNISFEEVKKHIENMTGLSEEETLETLSKVDEIKAVVESQESKKSKWQKIKPILVWLADKSVDVGISILPLLLKIGS